MYLVTGGAGFIGSNFLHYISNDTDLIEPVVVIDNLSYAADQKFIPDTDQFIFEWCDISNERNVNYIFEKYKPRKVFHFAAESHVDRSIKNYRPFRIKCGWHNQFIECQSQSRVEKFITSLDEVYGSLEYWTKYYSRRRHL